MSIDGPEERVSGLLAILIVILLVVIPGADLFTAFWSANSIGVSFREHQSFANYQLYAWFSAGISGLLSISLGLILAAGRSPVSVYIVLVGIWVLGPAHGLVTSLIERQYFENVPAVARHSDGAGIIPRLLLSLIGPIFWSLYLLSSEKVAKIYGTRRLWNDNAPSKAAVAPVVMEDSSMPNEGLATPVLDLEWVAIKSYTSKRDEAILERDRAILAANHIDHELRQAHMITVFVKGRDLGRADALINGSPSSGDPND